MILRSIPSCIENLNPVSRQQTSTALDFFLMGITASQPIHGYNVYKELDQPDDPGMIWRLNLSLFYALLECWRTTTGSFPHDRNIPPLTIKINHLNSVSTT